MCIGEILNTCLSYWCRHGIQVIRGPGSGNLGDWSFWSSIQRSACSPICEYCGALRFPSEGPSFCCRQGKVNIVNTPIPDELRHLLTSQTDMDALYFRKNIQYFNSHFSFTSFGATVDHRVATAAGDYFLTIFSRCLCTLLFILYILVNNWPCWFICIYRYWNLYF